MPPEKDTTQTGVSAEETQTPTDAKIMTDATNPRRGPVIADIAAKRREQLLEDGWDLHEEGAEDRLRAALTEEGALVAEALAAVWAPVVH